MFKLMALLASSLLMTSVAQADVLGFSVGANYWNYDMKGDIHSEIAAGDSVDISYKDNNDVNFFMTFEHPVPFLPNLKLQQNNIQGDGFINIRIPDPLSIVSTRVKNDIDLSHTDVVLYYELLDNWVNLDLGLSVKYFNGHNRFQYKLLGQNAVSDESKFDDWVPMLYARAQFDLPFSGFSAAATVQALSFDSNYANDIDLALKYQSKLGLGADLGYRVLDVDLKNHKGFKSDLKVDGFYLGANFNF